MDCNPPGSSVYGISRQESWNGLPFPIPEDFPNPGVEPTTPVSPALGGGFFTTMLTEKCINPRNYLAKMPIANLNSLD